MLHFSFQVDQPALSYVMYFGLPKSVRWNRALNDLDLIGCEALNNFQSKSN